MTDSDLNPLNTLKDRATELFSLCDQERKGFITKNDLVQVITELGLPLESKQVEQAFGKLDNDQNGYLTLDEFIEGFGLFLGIDINDLNDNSELEEIASSDPGRELFYLCDTDRKGYITKPDLQRVSYDLNLNFDQLDLIFDKLDQDGNGRLTLDEFAEGFGAFLRGGDDVEESNVIEQDDGIEVEFDQPRDVFESASLSDPSSTTKEDAVFREVVESIGEDVLSGALSKEQLRELWESLQHNDSRAIHKFEDFLSKVSTEIKRARNDSEQLENALKSKMNSHDREVQKLYEEMEQQIKTVKERYESEQDKRERAIKGDLMSELERKEMEIQWMLNRQKKLEEKVTENDKLQHDIKSENEMLLQKNLTLEDQLTDSVMSLEDTRSYVQHLQTVTAEEKEERARHALKMTEGMQLEQESLVQQLDLLRDVNQKLRDDRDSIEAAHKAVSRSAVITFDREGIIKNITKKFTFSFKRDRGHSLSDEIEEAEKHKKVNRQGSKMSKYFSGPPRSPTSPDWGKQGACESIDEEGNHHRTSDESKPRRRSKRSKRIKKQSAVGPNYYSVNSNERSSTDSLHGGFPMGLSMNQEVEFEGDVELGKIVDDKPATSGWASNIMAAYRQVEDEQQKKEVEDFRQRKAQLLISVEERSSEDNSDAVFSSEEYSGSDSGGRPRSPRTAPIGKDDESLQAESASMTSLAPAKATTPVRVFKVVIVGDSGVGKSSFLHRFCHDQWKPSFTATIGNPILTAGIPILTAGNPILTTGSPILTTGNPILTTGNPILTTVSPILTTVSPILTTGNPILTTGNPILTTGSPILTTGNPILTTGSPILTTGNPILTTGSPILTTVSPILTTGVDFQIKTMIVNDRCIAIQLWDTAGQERFRSITKQYFRKADGILIFYDVTAESSFINLKSWMSSVEEEAEENAALMVVGSKIDLAEDSNTRVVKTEDAEKLAKYHNALYMETSAKVGHNINESMIKLA
ncbi:hypothetical protein QZH41_019787, partial [Actinostola sp. cb2023]